MSDFFQAGEFSAEIVKEIHKLINEEVILTNEEGFIIASTDNSRLHEFHEGALMAVEKKERLVMTEELSKSLRGVHKGIVLPIITQGKAVGVVGITGKPQVVEPYAMLVQKVTELFIQDTMNRMDEERQARELEFFVFDWLNTSKVNKALVDRSQFFNIDMNKYEQVIVLQTKNSALQLSYSDIHSLKSIWDHNGEVLFIRWGQNKLLMLISQYETTRLKSKLTQFLREMKALYKIEAAVGVGQPTSFERLKDSLNKAERACEVSLKRGEIVFEEELRFDILQYGLSEENKLEFVERTIKPLKTEKVLLHTLDQWFQHDMSILKTAKSMHIHKNTLNYRLRKIEDLTHLDLKSVHDIVLLYVGYRLLFDSTV